MPTLKYLAPYVHRVAISDKRIVAVDEKSVTYTVRPSKSDRIVTRKVTGEQFVGGFTQHVLPRGFQKIRHYGWMSANTKLSLEHVQMLVWFFLGWSFWLGSGHAPQEKPLRAPLVCADCGGEMRVTGVTYQPIAESELSPHGLTCQDSG